MPKLRRLSGREVVRILEGFGFAVTRVRGSHHIMRRTVTVMSADGEQKETQTVNVPVHGNTPLAPGMLKRLYRDTLRYVPEDELKTHFYVD